MNNVNLIGRLTKKPELKKTPNQKSLVRFTLAVPGFKKDQTDFVLVEVWGKTAENVVNFVDKGHRVAVIGSIKSDDYIKDGKKVYVTYVLGDRVEFLEPATKKEFEKETIPEVSDDDLPF